MYSIHFVVSGRGNFPVDMLRRDACFPTSTNDAVNMLGDGPVRIELTHYDPQKYWEPTIGRWESFGWKVETVRVARKF